MEIIKDDIAMLKEKMDRLEAGQTDIKITQAGAIRDITDIKVVQADMVKSIAKSEATLQLILNHVRVVDHVVVVQAAHTEKLAQGKEDRLNIWSTLNKVKEGVFTNKGEAKLFLRWYLVSRK